MPNNTSITLTLTAMHYWPNRNQWGIVQSSRPSQLEAPTIDSPCLYVHPPLSLSLSLSLSLQKPDVLFLFSFSRLGREASEIQRGTRIRPKARWCYVLLCVAVPFNTEWLSGAPGFQVLSWGKLQVCQRPPGSDTGTSRACPGVFLSTSWAIYDGAVTFHPAPCVIHICTVWNTWGDQTCRPNRRGVSSAFVSLRFGSFPVQLWICPFFSSFNCLFLVRPFLPAVPLAILLCRLMYKGCREWDPTHTEKWKKWGWKGKHEDS